MEKNFYKCSRCKEGMSVEGVIPEGVIHNGKCKGELRRLQRPKTLSPDWVPPQINNSSLLAIELEDEAANEVCQHDYRVLTNSIDVIEFRSCTGIEEVRWEGMALFHCTKCLDVQKRVFG